MESIREIEKQMAELAARIKETKGRLPAHSVKPPVMMELLDLEDEYDRLKKSGTDSRQKALLRPDGLWPAIESQRSLLGRGLVPAGGKPGSDRGFTLLKYEKKAICRI